MPDKKPTDPEGTPAEAAKHEQEPASPAAAAAVKQDNAPDPAPEPAADPEGELADAKNQLLRALADMENLRRRTDREIADARQYAVSSFARDMLTVSDNLKRAIAAVPPELRETGDKALVSFVEGVEVTERGLEQTLAKFGIKPIEAKGQKFDPTVHQAMYEVESDTVPAGHVADVFQDGYMIGERMLRPAMVGVAKAPKAESGAPEAKAEAAGKTEVASEVGDRAGPS